MSRTALHASLHPLSQLIAMFPQFIASEQQTIVLKERILSLSGDSFDIKLESGVPLLTVNGNKFSPTGRKKVTDPNGTHLFDLRKEHFHLHTTYLIEDPNRERMGEVKNSHKFIGSKATATLTDMHGKPVTLLMEGNWNDRIAKVVHEESGQAVALISRKRFTGRHIIFGQDTYIVTVPPGVDMALVAGLCICFDEKNND